MVEMSDKLSFGEVLMTMNPKMLLSTELYLMMLPRLDLAKNQLYSLHQYRCDDGEMRSGKFY